MSGIERDPDGSSPSRSVTWSSLVYPLTGVGVLVVLIALVVIAARRIRRKYGQTEVEDRPEEPAPPPAGGVNFG